MQAKHEEGATARMFELSVANKVATLTLGRPPVNALCEALIGEFTGALDELAARTDWTVLHLRSSQKVFCAGADINEIRERILASDGPDRMYAYAAGLQRLYARIEVLPQITVAEIGGAATGGGLELALACDLRIAAVEAKLGLPEVRLGLIPGAGGTQRLTRLAGRPVAQRLILGAELVDGATARDLGIVQWAVSRAELPRHAADLAQRIAELPAAALSEAKSCIAAAGEPGRGGYSSELEATRILLTNPETLRRVDAFFGRASA